MFIKSHCLFYTNYTIIGSGFIPYNLYNFKPNHKQFQPYDYQHRVHNPLFVCLLSSPFPHPFFVDVCRRYAFNFRNDSAARLFPRLVNSVLELFFYWFHHMRVSLRHDSSWPLIQSEFLANICGRIYICYYLTNVYTFLLILLFRIMIYEQ